jgi:hypothetical protein
VKKQADPKGTSPPEKATGAAVVLRIIAPPKRKRKKKSSKATRGTKQAARRSTSVGSIESQRVSTEQLRADRDRLLAEVAQHGDVLQHALATLRGDREVVLATLVQHGDALRCATSALRRQEAQLWAEVARRATAAANTAHTAAAASADASAAAASAEASAAEPAVVLERVQTAAEWAAASRASAIELDDYAASDPTAPAAAKRRRVEAAPLTALPTPKPADQEELKRLRTQLTARRPSMIYELQGVPLEEPIKHLEGLPPLFEGYPRFKAAVHKLQRGKGCDPMKELMLLRQCVSQYTPAQPRAKPHRTPMANVRPT